MIKDLGRHAALALLWCVLCLNGCGQVPRHLTYRDGTAPQNVDKEVRFRTTYYFRVYDFCENITSGEKLQPVTDSLYRFVMTGKANAFSNKTAFESGTLTADQIDPFGASIEVDDTTGRMRVVSDAELASRRRNQVALDDIETLVKLRQQLATFKEDGTAEILKDSSLPLNEAISAVDEQIKAAAGRVGGPIAPSPSNDGTGSYESGGELSLQDAKRAALCPPGSVLQRGFQIMGPQGLKTYRQDERLVMAMSSTAEPLLAALQEANGRILQVRASAMSSGGGVVTLLQEQLRLSRAQTAILKAPAEPAEKDIKDLAEALAKEFGE